MLKQTGDFFAPSGLYIHKYIIVLIIYLSVLIYGQFPPSRMLCLKFSPLKIKLFKPEKHRCYILKYIGYRLLQHATCMLLLNIICENSF